MEQCSWLSFCQVRYQISIGSLFIAILSQISSYSVASTNDAAFVIGGYTGSSTLDVIAQFKDNAWSLYGNLQKPRSSQASITSGDMTMIIGGNASNG